jgi:uncharacterized protein (TIGR02677 family)
VLAIAERLIERRSSRVDRAGVLLHLAGRVASAPRGEPTSWLRAAFGLRSPRHLGVPEEQPEQVPDRGRTSWQAAPAAPVVAHLRRPGVRMPGTGRGTPIADLADGRRVFLERRQAERSELDALLSRMAGRGPARLSSLERVDRTEFSHLLDWIGRAYESAALPDGTRVADSRDGRAAVVLRPPEDPSRDRARLQTAHGTLELPDFEIAVRTR